VLELDMTCPHCHEAVHIVFHEQNQDASKECPRCGKPIPYPASEMKSTEKALGELEKGLNELAKLGR
jgi:uncharacterized Zn finger protein